MAETITINVTKKQIKAVPLVTEVKVVTQGRGLPGKDGVTPYYASTHYEFPNVGAKNTLYIATDEHAMYYWDEAGLKYYCCGTDYSDIKIIDGGDSANV